MRRGARKSGSLRARLLRWLLLPLGALWVVDAIHTFLTVRSAINAAYDRSLYASVLAISERITLTGTMPTVDIPPLALEVLDTASQERLSTGWGSGPRQRGDLPHRLPRPAPTPGAERERRLLRSELGRRENLVNRM